MKNSEKDFCIIDWELWHKMQKPQKIKTTYDFEEYRSVDSKKVREIALKRLQEFRLYITEIIRCAEEGKFSTSFTEIDITTIKMLESLGYGVEWKEDDENGYWLVTW